MASERYKPNGPPLSEYEREVLVILMEECSEVIQAASKIVRFGKESYPDYGENIAVLGAEVGDLLCMIDLALGQKLMRESDIHSGRSRKLERLKFYMLTEPQ